MRISVFSSQRYDREFLEAANAAGRHAPHFLDARLEPGTATLAAGSFQQLREAIGRLTPSPGLQGLLLAWFLLLFLEGAAGFGTSTKGGQQTETGRFRAPSPMPPFRKAIRGA